MCLVVEPVVVSTIVKPDEYWTEVTPETFAVRAATEIVFAFGRCDYLNEVSNVSV